MGLCAKCEKVYIPSYNMDKLDGTILQILYNGERNALK